jgi:lipopolysaccharide transport system permease protein
MKIVPRTGWQALDLSELWHFRDLLLMFAVRDVKLRYRQTALGVFWVILQPVLAAGIFSIVFGKIARLPSGDLPYFVFSYAGLLAWNVFSSTLVKSSNCLVQNAPLISKVFFPRLILPLSSFYATLVDFCVAGGLFLAILVFRGAPPSANLLWVPVWFLLVVCLALGFGFFTSALVVSYRDVQHILPVLIQLLLFASPVAYSTQAVPEFLKFFYFLNPLSGFLEAFRWSFFGGMDFPLLDVIYSALFTLGIFVCGLFYFKKMEQRFADVI